MELSLCANHSLALADLSIRCRHLPVCRLDVRVLTSSRYLSAGGTQYQRLSGSLLEGTDRDEMQPWTFHPIRYFWWLASWMIPGGGMFLEAYFIFRCARLSPRLCHWPASRVAAQVTVRAHALPSLCVAS